MAHYLTFDSSVTCTVNGTTVSSGYELHDGDVIVATATSVETTWFLVNDDGSRSNIYSSGNTVDVYDDDVYVFAGNGGGSSGN